MNLLKPLKEVLEQGLPARKAKLTEDQVAYCKVNYHLLTDKPIIYVANVGESDLMDLDNCKYYQDVLAYASKENSQVIPVSAQIESDLSELSEEERKEYLAELNVKESGLEKVIKATYKLLNLSTFFTVGADECRAWTFKNNMSAPECAGVIHTDFQKGFICAEVYPYEAIHELGSEHAVKDAGKIRTEGKGYYPKDGELMLSGVCVPSPVGELAHSDGDVVYHAVSEAILGALALGDLGKHFPGTPEFKDIDSSIIVKRVVAMMDEKGYEINNVDVSITLEKPKLAPFIMEMRNSLALLLNTSLENVSVKAGTNEGIDDIGRGLAVKADAIVMLRKKGE